jgi:uncharacterized membrane protein
VTSSSHRRPEPPETTKRRNDVIPYRLEVRDAVWRRRGAEQAQELQAQQLIRVQDAAVVTWEAGQRKPKTRQMNDHKVGGALGGGFWGLLFGLIFFVPIIGLAIGAASGALLASLADVGISDKFIATVRDKVTPGTSALFLLSSDAVTDRVRDAFKGTEAELISTNLSAEQENKLREAFEEEAEV